MKIIADTATLIPPADGESYGLTVMPVCAAINNRTYQDYSEISSADFLELVKQGGVPSSSQPAMGAKNLANDPDRIQVMDSKTLAGPLRYLAKKAVALKD